MYSKGLGIGGFVLIAAMVGCGSSGSGGGTGTGGTSGSGSFSTSVPSGTKLSGLSTSQAMQLCNDFNSFATNTLAPDTCKELGLLGAAFSGGTTNAQLQAACTATYNSCLTGDGGLTTTTTMCDPTMLATNAGSATCTATVGDLTTCLNDSIAPLTSLPSCSTLTTASLAALSSDGGSSTTPASCTAVNNCNGVSTGG